MEVEEQIRQFIVSSFMLGNEAWSIGDDTSLLEAGVLDSTGVLEMVLFVGETFGIDVPLEDVVPENFDSISGLASYVRAHIAGSTEQATDVRPLRKQATQRVALI